MGVGGTKQILNTHYRWSCCSLAYAIPWLNHFPLLSLDLNLNVDKWSRIQLVCGVWTPCQQHRVTPGWMKAERKQGTSKDRKMNQQKVSMSGFQGTQDSWISQEIVLQMCFLHISKQWYWPVNLRSSILFILWECGTPVQNRKWVRLIAWVWLVHLYEPSCMSDLYNVHESCLWECSTSIQSLYTMFFFSSFFFFLYWSVMHWYKIQPVYCTGI